MDRELEDYKSVVPNYLLDQLEKLISTEFMALFPLLEKINIYSLRTIRMNSKIENTNILVRRGAKFKSV